MPADDPIQVSDVPGDEVGHQAVLQVRPDHLHRVEVRGVPRQPLQVQPREPPQQLPDERPLVVAPPVPDDDHLAPQVPQQAPQEPDDSLRVEVVIRVRPPVQPDPPPIGRDRDRGDRRDLIAVPPEPGQRGRSAPRRPGAADRRVEEEPALVDQDDVRALLAGLFLMRGQSSASQRATAGLSRSIARTSGFCGE